MKDNLEWGSTVPFVPDHIFHLRHTVSFRLTTLCPRSINQVLILKCRYGNDHTSRPLQKAHIILQQQCYLSVYTHTHTHRVCTVCNTCDIIGNAMQISSQKHTQTHTQTHMHRLLNCCQTMPSCLYIRDSKIFTQQKGQHCSHWSESQTFCGRNFHGGRWQWKKYAHFVHKAVI